jgi:holo-[acyl-carrier protein] synthase
LQNELQKAKPVTINRISIGLLVGKEKAVVKGTGVDIIEISRIQKAVESSDGFTARIFTAGELVACGEGKKKWASLAARFAAKEAVAKAFGTGLGKFRFTDIEVVSEISGQPRVQLHGEALVVAGQLGINDFSLSISHCQEYAVAFVVAY